MFCSSAFDMHLSVAILRVPEGLDYTGLINEVNFGPAAVSSNPTSAVADSQPAASAADASAHIKPSNSSASGWPEGRTFDRQQSRESLHSQGNRSSSDYAVTIVIMLYYAIIIQRYWFL